MAEWFWIAVVLIVIDRSIKIAVLIRAERRAYRVVSDAMNEMHQMQMALFAQK